MRNSECEVRSEGKFLLKQKSLFNKKVFLSEKTINNFEFRTSHFEFSILNQKIEVVTK